MRIRRATAEDAPACAAIVADWIAATAWMEAGPARDALETAMRDGIPKREAWIAEAGDAVAGYLSMRLEAAHIVGLYARAPGHGAGRALLDHVKRGRDRLQLNSHAPNHAAHRFYAREGFRIVARDLEGDDGGPEIRMEWTR
ncbi:GNAT family N-acetyltransferase [Jannaschia ovalis]|uniref:GNAT family N-acetyltransferase n=1 Tax=Jannaschia ovalis TaxID=3038773 RepID=A0ABY8L9T3_9RHOB|nr:GNAT family N-acetyltransferase [Jannaschia sp. GRR-S6-38]WGH77881.1 GNAT family N-acetyltransferase [Jannaschia sp. GRR-S6-38]